MDSLNNISELIKQWQESVTGFLPKAFLSLIVLLIFYFLAKLFQRLSLHFYTRVFKGKSDVVRVISTLIFFFFFLSGVFIALEILGLESVLTKLLAGAGIVGIVAGFAFKDIASNAFAGLLLNTQRPFSVGDWVSIDDKFGTIKKIGWITTSIKTISGQEVFVPNQLIYNSTFTNFSTYAKRLVIFKSGVSYGDDLELVRKAALEEVDKIEEVIKGEEVDFFFTDIGSSAYNFEVRFWIKYQHQKDYLRAKNEIIMRIKKRFEEENISLAYNVTTLDFGVKGGVNLFDQAIEIRNK